jgi:hypothetical protein
MDVSDCDGGHLFTSLGTGTVKAVGGAAAWLQRMGKILHGRTAGSWKAPVTMDREATSSFWLAIPPRSQHRGFHRTRRHKF